jgi:hypothetical protein
MIVAGVHVPGALPLCAFTHALPAAEERQADNAAHGVGLASLPPAAQQDVALVVGAALGLGVNSTHLDALLVASSARMVEAMREAKQQASWPAPPCVLEGEGTAARGPGRCALLQQQSAAADPAPLCVWCISALA